MLEGQIALSTLLQRMRELALTTETLEYRDNYTLRGLRSLPVTFRAV